MWLSPAPQALWASLADRVWELIRPKPDLTLRELRADLGAELSVQTLCTALQQFRLTVEKSAYRRRAGTATVASGSARFIGETCAKTNMTRPRGRASKGERLLASVLHGPWQTTTFLAALCSTGLTAPLFVNGAISGEISLRWIRHHLVPTRQAGDVVVMDNLGVHQVAGVREAIAAVNARVGYLPPYSLDLTPIELVFKTCKWLLQSASARTVDALWSVCGDALDRFTEAECRNCFKHCGHRST